MTISVFVSDWPAARRFYGQTLGLPETFVVEDAGWAEFTVVDGVVIGLNALNGDPHPGPGGTTIVLGVEDVDASRAELEAAGVEFVGATEEVPGMVRLAGFRDLDGNSLMLSQSLVPS
jgi:predicted enzyme related to lactoylglutathione lyase